MSEPKYRDWILQTIDSLRSRKARPDLDRICRMVRRRHGSNPERTRAELEKLIREQTVLKVSYKGSISYRNAAMVQRKNRKETELTVVIVGSDGGAQEEEEGVREHEHLYNNNNNNNNNNKSDSAQHSCSELEGELALDGSGPSPGACRDPGDPPASDPGSGSSCQGGCSDATTTEENEASAPRVSRGLSEQQGAALSPRTGARKRQLTPSDPSSSRSALSPPPQQHRVRHLATAKPKSRPCGGSRSPGISEPGDRLLAAARTSRVRRCTSYSSSSSSRGHIKPLGLKEILGYLSSQEQLSEERLTRGKVKVVMEREVAGGRLRRTRCGNIMQPSRGAYESIAPTKQQLQKAEESEPSEEDNEKKKEWPQEEEQEQEDRRSHVKDGGLSPVAMTTEPELVSEDAGIQSAAVQQTPPWCSGRDVAANHSRPLPSIQESTGTQPREGKTSSSNQSCSVNSLRYSISNTSERLNGVKSRGAEGQISCPLTPTSSITLGGVLQEQQLNSEDGSGGCIKCEGAASSPLDWTVSDVVSYFTAAGFPEQATAFRTQEIDGKSLLLMQRNDVLTGLSIRLGPALKIYESHVKVLQRSNFEEDDS